MDISKIKKLIEILKNSDISKIQISEGKELIKINRKISKENSKINQNKSKLTKEKKNSNNKNIESIKKNKNNSKKETKKDNYIVKSPIVGTFYRSPSPKSKPFIEIGQKIKKGDPLCIVEAMKMMNQIESEKNGIIHSILLKNGETVEFNEPIIIIKLLEY